MVSGQDVPFDQSQWLPSGNDKIAIENGVVEIWSFPIDSMVIFQFVCCEGLPERYIGKTSPSSDPRCHLSLEDLHTEKLLLQALFENSASHGHRMVSDWLSFKHEPSRALEWGYSWFVSLLIMLDSLINA